MKTLAVLSMLMLAASGAAVAQSYPTKPVTMVIGYPAGGGADRMGRIVAQKLSERLGQQVVVDNRGGASGVIGLGSVARAEPDGYTIYCGGNPEFALMPLLTAVPYKPFEDLAMLSVATLSPTLVVVNASFKAQDMKAVVAAAREKNGVAYGTPGPASPMQLGMELFNIDHGTNFIHVPYKGGGPVTTDVAGGQIGVAIVNAPPLMPQLAAGRIKAIAVMQNARTPLFPDVPTVKEATGLDTMEVQASFLFAVPAKVPAAIRQRLETEIRAVLLAPGMKEQLAPLAMDVAAMTPAESVAYLQAESAGYAKVIKAKNIKLE